MNNQVALNLIEAIVSAKCNTIIDGIDCDTISVFSNTNGDVYCKTIDIDDITGIQFQK